MIFSLRKACRPTGLVLALALASAGCDEHRGLECAPGVFGPQIERIDVHELGARLGMSVRQSCRTIATLRNGANAVVIYADPDGEAYVNGTPVPDTGGSVSADGVLRVPSSLSAKLRPLLRAEGIVRPVIVPGPVAPRPSPRSRGRVVLDPGHGGRDPGAISVRGDYEKDVVLAVSRLATAALRARGVDVKLTRNSDCFLELEDRPAVANRLEADLFVSIHADSAPNRAARGFTVYVSRSASAACRRAGACMVRGLNGSGAANRGIRPADYRVLVHARCPAVLVELGYLSNREEAAQLVEPTYQRRLAEAVVRGVLAFLDGEGSS